MTKGIINAKILLHFFPGVDIKKNKRIVLLRTLVSYIRDIKGKQ